MVPSINFFPYKRSLHTEVRHQSRGVAPSDFRPLRKILDCGLPQEYGPCLSSIGGGQALTSPRRLSLGSPLHYQQADIPQAVPKALKLYPEGTIRYYSGFLRVMPDFRVRKPTCYYLVCHGSKPIRLACLIHAASVHPELGSNSKLNSTNVEIIVNETKEKLLYFCV